MMLFHLFLTEKGNMVCGIGRWKLDPTGHSNTLMALILTLFTYFASQRKTLWAIPTQGRSRIQL